jgi:hypothetical protein
VNESPAGILQGDLQDQRITGYHSPLGVTRTQAVTLLKASWN